jgi:hypothetical protein
LEPLKSTNRPFRVSTTLSDSFGTNARSARSRYSVSLLESVSLSTWLTPLETEPVTITGFGGAAAGAAGG